VCHISRDVSPLLILEWRFIAYLLMVHHGSSKGGGEFFSWNLDISNFYFAPSTWGFCIRLGGILGVSGFNPPSSIVLIGCFAFS